MSGTLCIRRHKDMLTYNRTLTNARQFAAEGRLEEWIHAYLCSDGHNKPFSDGLRLEKRFYLGPMEMPLSLFTRCCGPEASMQWQVDEDSFRKHTDSLADAIRNHADLPPLIVQFTAEPPSETGGNATGRFTLNDGNHRFEAFRQVGIRQYSVIIWGTSPADREQFLTGYSQYL